MEGQSIPSFEPTYEELKPNLAQDLGNKYRGFEPTYEELKLTITTKTPYFPLSFEPTYEELKQVPPTRLHSWATGFEPTYEELKQYFLRLYTFAFQPFWAYLWGIETYSSSPSGHQLLTRFEPTYEELKRGLFLGTRTNQIRFEPTYEELKPFSTVSCFFNRTAFWAYLWGIETYLWLRHVPCFKKVLSLPMRNWNMSPQPVAYYTVLDRFWAYLWGIETSLY